MISITRPTSTITTSKTAADLAAGAEAREDIRYFAAEIAYMETHDMREELANSPEVHSEISLRLRRRRYPLNDELSGKVGSIANPRGILGVIENPHFVAAHPVPGHDESKPGLTFSMHIPEGALQQARDGASSASVSLAEYVGECALDGIYRGYR